MNKLKEMFYNAISKDIIQKNFKATGNRLAKGSLDPEEEKMIVTIAKDKQSKMIFLSIENEEGTTYSLPLNEDFIRTLNDLFEKWYLLASTEFVWQITNSTKWEAIPIPQKKGSTKLPFEPLKTIKSDSSLKEAQDWIASINFLQTNQLYYKLNEEGTKKQIFCK